MVCIFQTDSVVILLLDYVILAREVGWWGGHQALEKRGEYYRHVSSLIRLIELKIYALAACVQRTVVTNPLVRYCSQVYLFRWRTGMPFDLEISGII